MIRAISRVFLTVILLLALIAGGVWFVGTQTDLFQTTAANTLVNSSGITSQIENTLHANAGLIAEKLGMSEEAVDAAITDLDISSWRATELPDGVTSTDAYAFEYEGTPVNATFYDDPNYVTLDVGGHEVTLQISESAQQYRQFLP